MACKNIAISYETRGRLSASDVCSDLVAFGPSSWIRTFQVCMLTWSECSDRDAGGMICHVKQKVEWAGIMLLVLTFEQIVYRMLNS